MIRSPSVRPVSKFPAFAALAIALLLTAATTRADPVGLTTNQVPNPAFRGTGETFGNGTVIGEAPAQWRAFARGTSGTNAVTVERVPLAAGALFPGSPPTNAVRFTVDDYGAGFPNDDQALDHSEVTFRVRPGPTYQGSVYLRSTGSDQFVFISLPLLNNDGSFSGLEPGGFTATVNNQWTRYEGAAFTVDQPYLSTFGFRLLDDGGDASVEIALPTVEGPLRANRVPNAGFEGTGGAVLGSVAGTVPDSWRAFALAGADAAITTVPLAADALYPGSPPTNAIEFRVDAFSSAVGFDHETNLFSLEPAGEALWAEVYLRSVNPDNSPQATSVATPVFDSGGFTGRQPGDFFRTVATEWDYYAGPGFVEVADTFMDLAFRLIDDGGDNIIQIALPTLLAPEQLLVDGFE